MELLANVVSLAVWTPFNEGWGQFDANSVAREVAALDPTRQVNHVSGWVDQGGGDVRSFHCYLRPFRMPRRSRGRRGRRVVALSEYGGYSLRVEGHAWSSREYGYRHLEDSDEFDEAFNIAARAARRSRARAASGPRSTPSSATSRTRSTGW